MDIHEILYAIWLHLYNFKTVKNTHGGLLLLAKLQATTCGFTKSNIPPWVFFTFLKVYKWYQIGQRISYMLAGNFVIYSAKISRFWKTDPKITRPVIINELIDTNLPQYAVGPGGEKTTQVGCCWNAGPLHFDGIENLWLFLGHTTR